MLWGAAGSEVVSKPHEAVPTPLKVVRAPPNAVPAPLEVVPAPRKALRVWLGVVSFCMLFYLKQNCS